MGTPSCPGAFPLGNARMALWISFNVRFLVRLEFVSSETLAGTLFQHWSWASAVSGASASEVYR